MKCWLGVVSKKHVMRGVTGVVNNHGVHTGFAQVCHGKGGPLRKMSAGDWFVYYSPKTTFPSGEKLQAFTAIGQVRSGEVYQVEMFKDFTPFRIDIDYRADCTEVPAASLKSSLSIMQDKWGWKLRSGHFEVPFEDFQKIAKAMNVDMGAETKTEDLVDLALKK